MIGFESLFVDAEGFRQGLKKGDWEMMGLYLRQQSLVFDLAIEDV